MIDQRPYTIWYRSPSALQYSTGLHCTEYDQVYSSCSAALIETRLHKQFSYVSNRKHYYYTPHNMLLITLYYLRHYPHLRMLGVHYNLKLTTAHDMLKHVIHILCTEFVPSQILLSLNSLPQYPDPYHVLSDTKLIVDTTDICIQKPGRDAERKRFLVCKGTKRSFGVKVQITTDLHGKILHVDTAQSGSTHDLTIYRNSIISTLVNTLRKVVADKAYIGSNNVVTPKKTPRTRELSEAEEQMNAEISNVRVRIENMFQRMKVYNIVGSVYRGDREDFTLLTQIVKVVAALVNLTVQDHPIRR